MDHIEFGKALLDTLDLDPVYVMLVRANLSEKQLKKWLLAYWCFYKAGVASCFSELDDSEYYKYMMEAAVNKDKNWPRGMERRHFRGQAAIDGVAGLMKFGEPEKVVDFMTGHYLQVDVIDFDEIFHNVQDFPMFGPWIAWKISDMTERVLKYPVDFSHCDLGIYRDPVKGAAFIKYGDKEHDITRDEVMEVAYQLCEDFKDYKAPPSLDRPFNVQEAETVLCKYKAAYGHKHNKSFYHVGKDTYDVYESLQGWGDLAQELADKMPLKELFEWYVATGQASNVPTWLMEAYNGD